MKAGYSRLSVSTSIEGLRSFIEDAQTRILTPLVGSEMVTALQTWYDSRTSSSPGWPTSEDTAYSKLLPQVQKVLTLYTLYLASPHMVLDVGDKGLMEPSVDGNTQARMGVLDGYASGLLSSADASAENLLEFLEVNKSSYSVWDSSESRKLARSLFVDSGTRMAATIRLVQPRRFFLACLPSITRVEELVVSGFLGATLFETLKTALKNATASEKQLALIARIRPWVACLAAADCLPEMSIQIDVEGVRVISVNDSVKNRMPASIEQVAGLAAKYNSLATQYQGKVLEYLNANAADFGWTSTETETGLSSGVLPDNANKRSFRL
jgi:hypothetical protein